MLSSPSNNMYNRQYSPPPAYPPSQGGPPEYTENDAALLLGAVTPAPPRSSLHRISRPVALPQIANDYDSPFARGWNDDLLASGIEQRDWLKFIDGLNIAMAASPPLRVIGLAGRAIGFVPYHWAILADILLQAAVHTAMHVLSKSLTDHYLIRANKTYFEPRGFRVRLMKTDALKQFINRHEVQGGQREESGFSKFGKVLQTVALHIPLPIVGRAVEMFSDPVPRIDHNSPLNTTTRRLASLAPAIHPMSVDNLPPPTPPTSLLDKSSALAMKVDGWKTKRTQTSRDRNRHLLAVAEGRESMNDADYGDRRSRRNASKVMDGRETRKLRRRVAKADRLEANANNGVVWLVMINIDEDDQIQGRELADTPSRENIANSDWEEELDYED